MRSGLPAIDSSNSSCVSHVVRVALCERVDFFSVSLALAVRSRRTQSELYHNR